MQALQRSFRVLNSPIAQSAKSGMAEHLIKKHSGAAQLPRSDTHSSAVTSLTVRKVENTAMVAVAGNHVINTKTELMEALKGKYGASFVPEWLANKYTTSKNSFSLGRKEAKQFFFDASDALSIKGDPGVELKIMTGMAPFASDVSSSDPLYVLCFPKTGLSYKKPERADSNIYGIPHPHFNADLGSTCVKVPSRGLHTSHMVGQPEFITEGGQAVPEKSFLIKIHNENGQVSDKVELMQSWDDRV